MLDEYSKSMTEPDIKQIAIQAHRNAYASLLKATEVTDLTTIVPEFTVDWLGNPNSELFGLGLVKQPTRNIPQYHTTITMENVCLNVPALVNHFDIVSSLYFGYEGLEPCFRGMRPKRYDAEMPTQISNATHASHNVITFGWYGEDRLPLKYNGPFSFEVFIRPSRGVVMLQNIKYAVGKNREEFAQWYEMTYLQEYTGL